jgi:RNA polymerase sigma-70 factor, ECF subfamily
MTAVLSRDDTAPAAPTCAAPDADVADWVARVQAGDTDAFAPIYNRYHDTVFHYVRSKVWGHRQIAEDLTSETFLRALRRLNGFTWQGRDLGAWLVTIARNLTVDYLKSGRCRLEVATGDIFDDDHRCCFAFSSHEAGPHAETASYLAGRSLWRAVLELQPEQRECLVLRFLVGLSVAETAQEMGKTEGAIKALAYRAVRALVRMHPELAEWAAAA